MSSATTSKKPQSTSPTSLSSKSNKEHPDSDTSTKQSDSKRITKEELDKMFRDAAEECAKTTHEEALKKHPWLKYYMKATPTTADQVPDLWDEI
ncbi:uncharacterized protein GGS22DRAFT_187527 [Annulohypoxylon maeteangense]|uniref:uncharacterized protein n=1 Tax=Annulohypoxylon maeteangense TaxID=1927788 RepID=UPI00200841F9|nr:uncharacterized protein GGS22DRAFT_187527 [Annulohypoxylon maeteangense]KAI0886289.1 hypothetical protein GGS22DRAFT_187527 [Annulohypoxylon maeteangense]